MTATVTISMGGVKLEDVVRSEVRRLVEPGRGMGVAPESFGDAVEFARDVVIGALAGVDEEQADRIASELEALAERAEQELGAA